MVGFAAFSKWAAIAATVLAARAAAQAVKSPRSGSETVEERVAANLASAVEEDATRRRAAVERLVDLGPPAVPYLDESLRRGNRHAVRTAAIALGEIGTEAAGIALMRYFNQLRQPGNDVEVAILAAYALGATPGNTTETLVKLIENPGEVDHVRLAAALALARRTGRNSERLGALLTNAARKGDADPEVLAAIAVAAARNAPGVANKRIPALLKEVKDPAARAGCYLALAFLRNLTTGVNAAADLDSRDPVLTRCAILGTGDPPRRQDASGTEFREARIVALGLGASDRAALAFAPEEGDGALRAVWLGAAAARGWKEPLLRSPWTERNPGENGRFVAASLLALREGVVKADRDEWIQQARPTWQKRFDAGAALLLACLGDLPAAATFAADARIPPEAAPIARIVWLQLRQDLDRRRFELAVKGGAVEARVLPDVWLSEAASRLGEAMLGSGADVFQYQSRLPFTAKLLLPPNMSRRKRTLPTDHPMYADLWAHMKALPFDTMLIVPRDDGG